MIGRGKHIRIVLKEKCPIQVDGEPWLQKRSEMEILYHGQIPMLMQPRLSIDLNRTFLFQHNTNMLASSNHKGLAYPSLFINPFIRFTSSHTLAVA